MNTSAQAITTDNFREVQNLIYSVVHAFRNAQGGEWDDLLSEAHMAFMDAQESYRPELAAFTTHVYNMVWRRLQEKRRYERAKFRQTVELPPTLPAKAPLPVIEDRIADLSPDAQELARIALEDLDECEHKTSARAYLRRVVAEMGWTAAQYLSAFEEIRNAL